MKNVRQVTLNTFPPQLKLAHEGNNVEWWDLGAKLVDTLGDDEDEYEGSGSYEEGSGVGYEDDDDEDSTEGSGCVWDFEGSGACDDEDCCRPPWKQTTEAAPESTSVEATTMDDITIEETTTVAAPSDSRDGGSGATSLKAPSALSLLPLLAALWLVAW